MSDANLRVLERAAQSGDPEAIERYVAEWLRAGRRDPRRDPRVGDVVARRVAPLGEGRSRVTNRGTTCLTPHPSLVILPPINAPR